MERTIIKSELYSCKWLLAIIIVMVTIVEAALLIISVKEYSEWKNDVEASILDAEYAEAVRQSEIKYDKAYSSFFEAFEDIIEEFEEKKADYNYRIYLYESAENALYPTYTQKQILSNYKDKYEYASLDLGVKVRLDETYAAKSLGYNTADDFYAAETNGFESAHAFAVDGVGYTKEEYVKRVVGDRKDFKGEVSYGKGFSSFYSFADAVLPLLIIPLAFVACYAYGQTSIEVTDKRIIGKKGILFFKKRLDIPMHRLTATAFGGLGRVYLGSSAGKLRFWLIKNNAEIHAAVCDLLIAQQTEKTEQ